MGIKQIYHDVLTRLTNMDYERKGGGSKERPIIPLKIRAKGTKLKDRIPKHPLFLTQFYILLKVGIAVF